MSLNYNILLSCWFINPAVGSCDNILVQYGIQVQLCGFPGWINLMKYCVEKLVQLLYCCLPLPCYPEHHSHVHAHTELWNSLSWSYFRAWGRNSWSVLKCWWCFPHKISFKFSLYFLLKEKAGGRGREACY